MCEWGTAKFLIISENVFSPLIYYSHITTALAALFFGVFIIINNPKALLNRILFFILGAFALWSFFDLILWASEKPEYIMFFWSALIHLDVLIYLGSFYFVYVFLFDRDLSFKAKLISILSVLPIIALANTQYNLLGFDYTNCDREAIEGPLWHYAYILETIFVLLILHLGVKAWRIVEKARRRQVLLITSGTVLFLLSFSFGNIIGSLSFDWDVAQYGLFGLPIFIGLLAYLTVKYKAFNVKVVGTHMLVAALWLMVLSLLFINDLVLLHIIVGITLILVIIFGIILGKSVKMEVKHREEMEKLYAELKVTNEKLRELDQQKSEFISLASHQLRGPLTAIKGYVSMIMEGDFGKFSQQIKEALETIFKSTQALVVIVGDYLDISRIEQGRMKYDFVDFDAKELIKTVITEMTPNIQISNLTIDFKCDETKDYFVRADQGKIKQVISNLIDNSTKYTKQGGITVGIDRNRRDNVLISIKDTGVGIDKEVLPRLFEKFTRAPDASKANIMGTGLGLYIAKKIIEAHRGKIWAESEGKGKGSTFFIELEPLHSQKKPQFKEVITGRWPNTDEMAN